VLLDRRLPDGDGLALLRRMRCSQPGVPVIVLTALDSVPDRVHGLDAGADDYVSKPYNCDELLARIRAALRRPGGEAAPRIVCGEITFDPATREVTVRGTPTILGRRELALLSALMRRRGRVVVRETLLDEVYGCDGQVNSNTLDAHVSRLRARLTRSAAGVAVHPVRGGERSGRERRRGPRSRHHRGGPALRVRALPCSEASLAPTRQAGAMNG
jgi:DNA-binding response OmpR family regulator